MYHATSSRYVCLTCCINYAVHDKVYIVCCFVVMKEQYSSCNVCAVYDKERMSDERKLVSYTCPNEYTRGFDAS